MKTKGNEDNPSAIPTDESKATPGPYLREGRTVYVLQGTGTYSGKGQDYQEDMENRWTAHIEGWRAPEEEIEAVAALFAASPAILEALKEWSRLYNLKGLDRTLRRNMTRHASQLTTNALALVNKPAQSAKGE